MEKTIHKNFQNIIRKTGLSIKDFFDKTKLLENLIDDISEIRSQKVTTVTAQTEKLTEYDE